MCLEHALELADRCEREGLTGFGWREHRPMKAAHFRVVALLEMASRPQIATVTIDRAANLFSVRVLRRRRVYTLPLADVASMVVRGLIRAEVLERARAKRERRRRQ